MACFNDKVLLRQADVAIHGLFYFLIQNELRQFSACEICRLTYHDKAPT